MGLLDGIFSYHGDMCRCQVCWGAHQQFHLQQHYMQTLQAAINKNLNEVHKQNNAEGNIIEGEFEVVQGGVAKLEKQE